MWSLLLETVLLIILLADQVGWVMINLSSRGHFLLFYSKSCSKESTVLMLDEVSHPRKDEKAEASDSFYCLFFASLF